MKNNSLLYTCFIAFFTLNACNNSPSNKQFQPIVLGDSATIVTETDKQYLLNNIDDIEAAKDTTTALPKVKPADQVVKQDSVPVVEKMDNKTTAVTAAPATSGIAIAVGNGTYLLLEGVTVNEKGSKDATTISELSYQITKGKYNSAVVKIHNGKFVKAQYRYAVLPQIEVSGKQIPATSLGNHILDWSTLSVKNNVVSAPTVNSLKYKEVSAQQLKSALESTLKDRKYKSSVIDGLSKQIGRKATIYQKPFSLELSNMQLKVQGTDSKGKTFEKTIKLEL